MDDQATRAIVERALAGDGEAFASLFREYDRDVRRVCRRMLGDSQSAEDAVSEVFLRARRALLRRHAERYGLGDTESDPMTLKEIGKIVGLTRERVRQIEQEALRKLYGVMGDE